eukprot:TRINITY_DN11055_c0_g1_i1.p1 TRINITY_DN11055_c0_g1~~TRINITY_DN11055_c0_g1_i1.p1  ORF type:complete len:212 (-),score=19.29 TRINITY_DN11055_c0_g1_i1:112-747(-)
MCIRDRLYSIAHIIYHKHISSNLPYLLRRPSHSLIVEAVAILFERLSQSPHFNSKKPLNTRQQRAQAFDKLLLARWSLALYDFERRFYSNPEQDIDKLWNGVIERYLLVRGSEKRGWTMVKWECYHDHLLSQMLASQLDHYIVTQILKEKDLLHAEYYGRKEIGEYLKKVVFAVGKSYKWDELIVNATSKILTPEFYMNEITLGINSKLSS